MFEENRNDFNVLLTTRNWKRILYRLIVWTLWTISVVAVWIRWNWTLKIILYWFLQKQSNKAKQLIVLIVRNFQTRITHSYIYMSIYNILYYIHNVLSDIQRYNKNCYNKRDEIICINIYKSIWNNALKSLFVRRKQRLRSGYHA